MAMDSVYTILIAFIYLHELFCLLSVNAINSWQDQQVTKRQVLRVITSLLRQGASIFVTRVWTYEHFYRWFTIANNFKKITFIDRFSINFILGKSVHPSEYRSVIVCNRVEQLARKCSGFFLVSPAARNQ